MEKSSHSSHYSPDFNLPKVNTNQNNIMARHEERNNENRIQIDIGRNTYSKSLSKEKNFKLVASLKFPSKGNEELKKKIIQYFSRDARIEAHVIMRGIDKIEGKNKVNRTELPAILFNDPDTLMVTLKKLFTNEKTYQLFQKVYSAQRGKLNPEEKEVSLKDIKNLVNQHYKTL